MSVERLTPLTLSFTGALFPWSDQTPAVLACLARVRLCVSLMVARIFFLTCFSGMCGTSWPLTFSYTEPRRESDNRCLWRNCTFSADPLSRRKNWIAAGLEVIFFSFFFFFEGEGGRGEREEHWYLYAKPFSFLRGREEHWCLYAKPETNSPH